MHSDADEVLVIGGGIAGLATAAALLRVGRSVRVFERAPEIAEVGAGLALWPNAIRALAAIGLDNAIRDTCLVLEYTELASSRGTTLTRARVADVLADEGPAAYVVHRADLQRMLQRALPPDSVVTGKEFFRLEVAGSDVVAQFRDGTTARGGALVAADGINSAVRAQLWPASRTRYSGQASYRAIAPVTPLEPNVLREVQGGGKRFGICPVDQKRVYWFTAFNAPAGEADDPAQRASMLTQMYAGWPWSIPELIAATPPSVMLRNDLIDLSPLKRWSRGRVTLVGDAAHAMLPNLGQGAGTSLEDAVVLARALAQGGSIEAAFERYENERRPRTRRIARDSWRLGHFVRWSNPLAVRMRELMVRAIPEPIMQAMLRTQMAHDVGRLD